MRAVPVLVSLVVLAAAFPLTGPAQAHPVDVVVEGEAFDTRDEGSLLADPAASGGAAWRLDGPGNVSTGWSGDHAGTYQISVWAKGSASGGPAPEMTVFDDGRAVGHWRVNDAYVRYVANDTVAQASHRLSVALTDVPPGAAQSLAIDKAEVFLVLVLGSGDPLPIWREAEGFPTRSGGSAIASDAASAGQAWSHATIATTFPVSGGLQYFLVTAWARADPAGDTVGKLVLRVDGAIVWSWYDVAPDWKPYAATVALFGGNHTLSLTFTDDVGAAGPGRALHADAVSIAKTAPVRPLGPAARVQAETFPARLGWGYSQRDPTASGGARWKQAGNGSIIMTYAPAGPGNVTFTITAKGEPALGAWPELKLRIDNATRIRWNASSWLYRTYTYRAFLDGSPHQIEIASYTAFRSPSANRTLYVDALDVLAERDPLPPPAPLPGPSDWPSQGRDPDNSRLNANEAAITRGNAASLAPAWNFHTPRAVTGSPVLLQGHVYLGDWGGTVYRLNATDGRQEWSRALGHGALSSTPLVADGRVFVGTGLGELAALDASNGSVLWITPLDSYNATRAYGAPTYHDGKVYVGVSSDQESNFYGDTPDFRGSVLRIDAATGHVDWRFYTVPPGFTGGAAWSAPALDAETMTLYYATGNAYTSPAHNRTNAIVALNATTGAFLWSFQAYPNDVWTSGDPEGPDADFGMAVRIWQDAHGRKLVGDGNKLGDFFALDAATGALVWRANSTFFGEGYLGAGSTAYGRQYGAIVAEGRVVCLDATTGALQWASTLSDRSFAGVAVADGIVFAGAIDGSVWAIHAGNGTILWRGAVPNATAAGVYGAPIAGEGTLLVPYEEWTYVWGTGGVAAFRPAVDQG